MSDNIQRHQITTRAGNTLSLFYNPDNDLLVIDLIHKNELGGNEIVRMTINEKKLLKHAVDQEKAQTRLESQYESVKGQKLSDCSDEGLRILLAYHQWKDGADWPVVCEIKDGPHFDRTEAIKTLQEVFQL
jgi:hypothetical protein